MDSFTSRYQLLEQIGAGGMGAVYRASDRLTGQIVALKRVLLQPLPGKTEHLRISIANEFRTLASLRHPHIISVLDYGFDAGRVPYFTMELLADAQQLLKYGREQSTERKIELLAQALQALAYLHRHGIVHRDLKPDNMLVVNGEVKLLDFGLAAAGGEIDPDGHISGTMAYLAPELIAGDPATERSDLYALGMVGYELLTGSYPFANDTASVLIHHILYSHPPIHNLRLDIDIQMLLERLLAKAPEDRFSSADDALRAIQMFQPGAVQEDEFIRESLLQAARFVGRETEMAQLTAALDAALAGQGGAWLVGGESGVGKSRLLEELRIRALVSGAVVMRGQETPESGTPYHLWRQLLRPLTLDMPLDAEDAGLLRAILPDIAHLTGRDTAELIIDPVEAAARLAQAVERLLRAQSRPLVLLLEDLHWSGESLGILQHLSAIVGDAPLLIVGTYRDDERPHLPEALPAMAVLKLPRLDETSVAALSESIVGEAGKQPQFVAFLQQQTEGNTFFLIEIMRTLAEAAGQLDRIPMMPLPEQVSAGGIQRVIARRLERVPAQYRPFLETAAVLGKRLDLAALRHIWGQAFPLDRALLACAEIAVLEVQDDQWRFVHDKLREGLVTALDAARAVQLHRQAADTLRTLHGERAAGAIGEHYAAAHEPREAAGWFLQAAAVHQAAYALESAIQYYQRALPLLEDDAAKINALRELGQLLRIQARNSEAVDVYEQMAGLAETAGDLRLQAEAWNWTSWAHDANGSYSASLETGLKAETLARQSPDAALELARAAFNVGWAHYRLANTADAQRYCEQALALTEQAGMVDEQIRVTNLLSAIAYSQSNYQAAIAYGEQLVAMIDRTGKMQRSKGVVLGNLGSFHQGLEQYDQAMVCFQQSLEEARKFNDIDSEMVTLVNMAQLLALMERYAEAEAMVNGLLARPQAQEWFALTTAYAVLAQAHLGQHRLMEALRAAQQSLHYIEKFMERDRIGEVFMIVAKIAEQAGMPVPFADGEYDSRAAYQKSLAVYRELDFPVSCIEVLETWADYEDRQDNPAEAQRLRDEAAAMKDAE